MARVLVLDDDPSVRLLLNLIVDTLGHEPISATTPAEACALLRRHEVDALIVDVLMPDADGVTFVEHVRQLGLAPPAVLLVSGLPPAQLAALARQAGATPIEKPFTIDSIEAALATTFAPSHVAA